MISSGPKYIIVGSLATAAALLAANNHYTSHASIDLNTTLNPPVLPSDNITPSRRRLSEALPNGGCKITWPKPPPPNIQITYAASYPGCGARMTWNLVEALTGLETGDDWNNNGRGANVVTVKTHYPQSNGILPEFDDRINRAFLVVRNPMQSIPSFFNHIYEMRNHLPVHSERAPVEEWIKWRDHYLEEEIAEYKKFTIYWMDRMTPENRYVITYEGLTDDLIGPEVTKGLNEFLGKAEGVDAIDRDSVPCVWKAVVKNQPPEHQKEQIAKLQSSKVGSELEMGGPSVKQGAAAGGVEAPNAANVAPPAMNAVPPAMEAPQAMNAPPEMEGNPALPPIPDVSGNPVVPPGASRTVGGTEIDQHMDQVEQEINQFNSMVNENSLQTMYMDQSAEKYKAKQHEIMFQQQAVDTQQMFQQQPADAQQMFQQQPADTQQMFQQQPADTQQMFQQQPADTQQMYQQQQQYPPISAENQIQYQQQPQQMMQAESQMQYQQQPQQMQQYGQYPQNPQMQQYQQPMQQQYGQYQQPMQMQQYQQPMQVQYEQQQSGNLRHRRLDPGHHDSQRKGPSVPRPYTVKQLQLMMNMLSELANRYKDDVRMNNIMKGYYEKVEKAKNEMAGAGGGGGSQEAPPGGFF